MLPTDIRYALRVLWKSPAFTFAAIATLALGIGANTAIFSVVNTEMLRFVPYPDSSRLLWIAEKNDKLHLPQWAGSVLNYLSWKEQAQSFESMGAIGGISFNLTGRGEPEQFQGARLTPSVSGILGIQPVRGRFFQEGEDVPGAPNVAMISEGLWKRRFGGDPALLGQTISLNSVSYTVVGIAPKSLALIASGDIWIPLTIDRPNELRLNHTVYIIGRLKRGVSIGQAQAEMDAVSQRVGQQFPEVKNWGIHLVTFYDWIVPQQLRTTLLVLMGAVALVLLIACANVANLLLSRGTARQREVAIRLAIGANRGRLLRQFLTESVILSALGGGAGLLAAFWTISFANASVVSTLLPIPEIHIDSRVLLFTVVVSFATGILFGMAPALRAAGADLNSVLKQSARSSIGLGRHWLRNGLVTAELALATMLLIGAGLLVQSLLRMQQVRVGFNEHNLLTFQVVLPIAKYGDATKTWAFWRRMLDSFDSTPGVKASAISSGIPFGAGSYNTTPVNTIGQTALPPGVDLPADWRQVSPGYFRAMEIPILSGRDFSYQDVPTAAPVVIVTKEAASRLWGDNNPMGRIVHVVGSGKDFTVIGVVGSVRNATLNQDIAPAIYFSGPARLSIAMDVAIRTDGPPDALLTAVRAKLHDVDPEIPITNVKSMEEWIAASASQQRLNAVLLAVFAGVALLIAAIGVYGVLSYSVSQRTREIGLRMALGARQATVLQLIVREGMLLAVTGIATGLLGALAISRVLSTLLFGIQGRDPLTFCVVAMSLGVVAVAACFVPAHRASQVDPMSALRED